MKSIHTILSLCLIPLFLMSCDSKRQNITVVQNGIGIVKNGIGEISAENMGTVIYDVAVEALNSSRLSGERRVEGRLGGTAEVLSGARENQVVIQFENFRSREAYPTFESGILTFDLNQNNARAIAKAEVQNLMIQETPLSARLEYDLVENEEGLLSGNMKGRVETTEKAYNINHPYDAPIILLLELNMNKIEPGQTLQSQVLISSNAPMSRISLDVRSEFAGETETFKGLEEELRQTAYVERAPGLWAYEYEGQLEDNTPAGKLSISNIRFTNKLEISTERRRNDSLSLEVVPRGSGVQQRFLPSLEELIAQLGGGVRGIPMITDPDENFPIEDLDDYFDEEEMWEYYSENFLRLRLNEDFNQALREFTHDPSFRLTDLEIEERWVVHRGHYAGNLMLEGEFRFVIFNERHSQIVLASSGPVEPHFRAVDHLSADGRYMVIPGKYTQPDLAKINIFDFSTSQPAETRYETWGDWMRDNEVSIDLTDHLYLGICTQTRERVQLSIVQNGGYLTRTRFIPFGEILR